MKQFTIYEVKNGFLLVIKTGQKSQWYIYTPQERMTMFAKIDKILGEEPSDSIGLENWGKDDA